MAKEKEKKPVLGTVKSVDRSAEIQEFYGLHTDRRENPNDFFGKGSTDTIQQVVKEMEETDPVLCGLFDMILSILGYPRKIEGEGRVADLVREQFSEIKNFNLILTHFLEAIKYGFSPIEFVWRQNGPFWWWEEILDWSPSRIEFDKYNKMVLRLDNGTYEVLNEDSKFKCITWGMKYGNRYGRAYYHILYYHTVFTRDNRLFWGIFNEGGVSPHTILSPPDNAAIQVMDDEDMDRGVDLLTNWKNSTGAVFKNPMEVKIIEAARDAGGSYEKFIKHLNQDKALLLTGNAEAAEVVTSGSYAKKKEETLLMQYKQAMYVDWLETFINDTMIKLFIDKNFTNVKPDDVPKWRIKVPEVAENSKEVIESLTMGAGAGMEIPVSHAASQMGIPARKGDEPILIPPKKEPPPEVNFAGELFKHEAMVWAADKELLKKE